MTDTTPMMRQYARIKEDHRDAILFFRLGDFYEMFRSDAKSASQILGLTLTSRQGVPMCGIPYHASKGYIARLIAAGKKVAICEQTRLPTGKGLAEREVVEVITPGTAVEEDLLESGRNNYLIAIGEADGWLSLAYVDVSTGELGLSGSQIQGSQQLLRRELARLQPREMLIQESLLEDSGVSRAVSELGDILVNRYPDWSFDLEASHRRLAAQLEVINLKAYGIEEDSRMPLAAGVLLDYVDESSRSILAHIKSMHIDSEEEFLGLDENTIRNLELVQSMQGGSSAYTLLRTLDYTRTAMGARTLRQWCLAPLQDLERIRRRQAQVGLLHQNQSVLNYVRDQLSHILDLERLAGRLAMERAHAKDLVAIGSSLAHATQLRHELQDGPAKALEFCVEFDASRRELAESLVKLITSALLDEPSILLTEGRLIRDGFNQELDGLRQMRDNSRGVLEEYVQSQRDQTGITGLKVRYNRVIGHYLEVTKSHSSKVPEHYIRRQSLTNAERFTTERLGEIESQINQAAERIVELERELFLGVRLEVASGLSMLSDLAGSLAAVDVIHSLAYAATVRGYTAPRVSNSQGLVIRAGRHPVVEAHLPPGEFVPNDTHLDTGSDYFALITGPNMAGKSTFLRQTALIVLMAQMGSFVPADDAEIGIVDRVFCRVGASDNLARGESTFLVEMSEAAFILRNASARSLVIMDEIGRGTSTNDGLSIAQAVTEHMVANTRCRTLFATHFHELTALKMAGMVNLSLEVLDDGRQIVFLKRVVPGPSSNAYGLHVAQLAGVPREVIRRADQILSELLLAKEDQPKSVPSPQITQETQAGLFDPGELIIQELRGIDLDQMKPIDALSRLARWQDELDLP